MPQVSLVIFGRVQGVFFRAETRRIAQSLGLTGWVKNNSDGSLSALAQGEKSKLEEFVTWCRHGPPGAEVQNVKIEGESPAEIFTDFSVRY